LSSFFVQKKFKSVSLCSSYTQVYITYSELKFRLAELVVITKIRKICCNEDSTNTKTLGLESYRTYKVVKSNKCRTSVWYFFCRSATISNLIWRILYRVPLQSCLQLTSVYARTYNTSFVLFDIMYPIVAI